LKIKCRAQSRDIPTERDLVKERQDRLLTNQKVDRSGLEMEVNKRHIFEEKRASAKVGGGFHGEKISTLRTCFSSHICTIHSKTSLFKKMKRLEMLEGK
jgi:hypothetical protein